MLSCFFDYGLENKITRNFDNKFHNSSLINTNVAGNEYGDDIVSIWSVTNVKILRHASVTQLRYLRNVNVLEAFH